MEKDPGIPLHLQDLRVDGKVALDQREGCLRSEGGIERKSKRLQIHISNAFVVYTGPFYKAREISLHFTLLQLDTVSKHHMYF